MNNRTLRIVAGGVSRITVGRMTAFTSPSTTAATSAVPKLSMRIDGIT